MCVCFGGWGSDEEEMCVCKCKSLRGVSPSLLWRLLNGSCTPGAGSAQYTSLNLSENPCVVLLS